MRDNEQEPIIFVVDDEPSARLTVEALLLSEGYEMHFAESGFEMLDNIGRISPDVILLDVMMPGMNGFDACAKLKADSRFRHIPVILLTALTDLTNLIRGLEAGADEFLTKPVNGSELRARVRSMLRIKMQYDELQTMVSMREDLANMTVHDLRTPLTTVALYADLVRRNAAKPERVVEYAQTISLQTQRLQALVNEILMMAKMERGALSIKREPIEMRELLDQISRDHEAAAQLQNVNFSIESAENLPHIEADKNLLRRVMDNLLTNAFKFSPPNGHVKLLIGVSASGKPDETPHLSMKIIDHGPGVPKEYRDLIFDKFAIVEMRNRDVPQLGLGLAFCKMVATAHGGDIWVEDNIPNGSTFILEIPQPELTISHT